MEYISIAGLMDFIDNFTIQEIEENVNFWMVRSKGGFFYDEFVKEGFIALGWNYIDQSTVIDSQTIDILKQGIKDRYGDKVPMTAINKCKRFIGEIKEGDYAIIPNSGSSQIAICKIGKYYENEEFDFKKENEIISRIDNKEFEINEIKCPYRKRRRIEVLLRVSTNRVNYNVLKALSSYHGLSSMNDYAVDILNCVYDCYGYKKQLYFTLNIGKKSPIRPREIAKLMYGITDFFCSIADEESVSTTMNLNSPGRIIILLKKGFRILTGKALPLAALYIIIAGGSGFGFEFPGLIGFIKECRTMEMEIEKQKLELDSQYIEGYRELIGLMKMAEEEGIDISSVLDSLETLEKLNESMHFENNEVFAVEKIETIME